MNRAELEALAPALDPPVTICVLLYGDHFFLCERFLPSLLKHTPPDAFHLRIGLNAVCDRTSAYVRASRTATPATRFIIRHQHLQRPDDPPHVS